jgi:hypothetical protein
VTLLADRWKRTFRASIVAALLAGVAAPSWGQTREMHSSLVGQLRMFQLRVMSGRIVATSRASQQNLTSNHKDGAMREQLAIDLAGGMPNVTYERSTRDEKISFEVVSGNKVTIEVMPRSTVDRPTLRFVQPAEGSLSLTVDVGDHVETYHAPTLWHLLVIESEVCHEHLIPLLEIMRPSWQLERRARQVEEALCQVDSNQVRLYHAAWQQSVAALTNDHYAQRERAEQQLLGSGPVVLPYLRSLERSDLDAEQRFRVRRVMRSLTSEGDEDTPERVTLWLTGDPRIWYALMSRSDLTVRRTALARLSRLLEAAVDFAPEASLAERNRQLATLRERFADVLDSPAPSNAPQ